MTVGDIMTSDLITVGPDDTVGGMAKILEPNHIHHIPVVEGTRILGVVSDRDILKATSPHANSPGEEARDANTLTQKASQIMTRKVIAICPEETVIEAARVMRENRFSCLPVLSTVGVLVGMVTDTDLLKCFVERVTAAQA